MANEMSESSIGHNWKATARQLLSNEFREVTGDRLIHDLLDIEGVDTNAIPNANASELEQLSINNFRILLEAKDPRWRLVYKMHRLKVEGILEGAQLEHALRADYLSDHPSIRRGFARYIDEITIPQLARALANIEIGNQVRPNLQDLLPLQTFYTCEYNAGRIGAHLKPDERGIMGCQEALWQLQLFQHLLGKEEFVGRIGFNFHFENGKRITSITNIQGAHNRPENNEVFTQINGHGFGEFLVTLLRSRLNSNFVFRGVEGRAENKALYKSVFKTYNIPQYEVPRLTKQPYSPTLEETFGLTDSS